MAVIWQFLSIEEFSSMLRLNNAEFTRVTIAIVFTTG
jgi:hypothetical protein